MLAKQRVPTAVGLLLVFAVPVALSLFRGTGAQKSSVDVQFNILISWAIVAALLALVHFWEREPFSSIGFHNPTWKDVGWGFGGFVLGILAFAAITPLVYNLDVGTTEGGIRKLAELPLHTRIMIVITAGVTEEVLFRGYPIERLIQWTGKPFLSAAIAYAFFVGLHAPFWGLGGALQIGFGLWS